MFWISTFLSSAGLLLLARWALRVARPQEDIAVVQRAVEHVCDWTRDAWTIFWRAYGPVTNDVRARWESLRARYRTGGYGMEGS